MKKKLLKTYSPPEGSAKILLTMKLAVVLLFFTVVQASAALYSQTIRVDVNTRGASLESVFEQIRQQSDLTFVYNLEDISDITDITLSLRSATVEDILKICLRGTGVAYELSDNTIVLRKDRQQPAAQQQGVTIRGTVRDTDGRAVVGAAVIIKGTARGTVTDAGGAFSISARSADNVVLVISFLSKKTVEVAYTGQQNVNVTLEDDTANIEEVVVTGMFDRRKESFTGASTTFTKEELRRVGNSNILQSIKNLDPSFRFEENLANGSNPNVEPEIRLRGQSGFSDLAGTYTSDPNAPYFIVDGFESSLTAVMDMDMNRIESVSLLKDAAAKAIYGSKAANGVVVIETTRPHSGKFRVTYSGSFNVQIPDLSSYDLTNAAEKLIVESNGGRFNYISDNGVYQLLNAIEQYNFTNSYYALFEQVLAGVDTDWLAQPTRVGLGQKHSFFIEGGDDTFQYGVDVSYNNVAGVMKASNRDTFSGGVKLSYRYRSLSFRNNLTVTYNKGVNSPYGKFSDYAKMNPYLRIFDDHGELLTIPAEYIPGSVTSSMPGITQRNPLYDATLNSKDFSEYTQINNNLYVEWTPFKGFKTTGRLSLTKEDSGTEVFIPAKNTMFLSYTTDELLKRKGRYTVIDGNSMNIAADINAQYSQFLGEKHFIFANVGWTLNNYTDKSHGLVAEGFPDNDKLDDVAFASQYADGGSPTSTESTTRSIGIVGAFNYSYHDCYLFDASLRMSASSQFGSDNRWGAFWALGVGWNLHNENFMEDTGWINTLKLRASVGYTGSQDFAAYQSQATFSYYTQDFYSGSGGAYLMSMSNSKLKWQRKLDKNIGIDIAFLNNRLSARFDYYMADTDDLLTSVTIPTSTGFKYYVANLGEVRNSGYEVNLRYQVWNNPEKRSFLNIFVVAAHNKSKITKISDYLKEYNDTQVAQAANGYIRRYLEGKSMTGIWAVPSAGIDPGTGNDLYITKDGLRTYKWNSDNLAECGNTEPDLNGSTGFNFDYMGFSINVVGTWRFGGHIYNQTLVDKVENADIAYNVDRRIFTSRWAGPGDKARFKSITDKTSTKATSRFVEDDNLFIISSINASYDFQGVNFIKDSGIERLRLIFDMADIGRLGSVKIERGTSYPFAYSFSLTLQAIF